MGVVVTEASRPLGFDHQAQRSATSGEQAFTAAQCQSAYGGGMLDAIARELPSLLVFLACCCAVRAAWIVMFYQPVKARFVGDGFREARRARDAAIFLGERAPMPLTVEDEVVFEDADGREVRARVRRLADRRGPSSLIWYLRRKPDRVSVTGPLGWIGVAAAILSGLLLF